MLGVRVRILNKFPDSPQLPARGPQRPHKLCEPPRQCKSSSGQGILLWESISGISSRASTTILLGTDRAFEGEVNFRTQGTPRLFGIECYPVKRREDTYTGIILTRMADKRVRSREEIQKHKMESIGMLAGGIAHDFNNLLTGILGYASLMKTAIPEDSKLFRYANVIETSAQRAAKLTGHLLNFVRRGRMPLDGVNLNTLLSDVLLLLKEGMRDIIVEKDLDESIPAIRGDESELQQVFLNLIVNARDAMDGEGVLKVTTEGRAARRRIRRNPSKGHGKRYR